tara:strand:+ start:1189 stop:1341 length:153 start_codon:yes stop_codon:yes gene_type:complete
VAKNSTLAVLKARLVSKMNLPKLPTANPTRISTVLNLPLVGRPLIWLMAV